jgi:DNA-binding response OmpR family regulator
MAQPVNSRRVLIVDDNLDLAENIAEILELDGFVTDIAPSAEDALEKIRETEPSVLVTDYRLPGANGASLVRQLREMGLRVHAVVISAYTDESTMADAKEAGAAFLPKPVDFQILGRVIRSQPGSA